MNEIPPGFIKKSWKCPECDFTNCVMTGLVDGKPLTTAQNCRHQFKASFAETCKYHDSIEV